VETFGFHASPLAWSYNRVYLTLCLRHFAQISFRGTLDTPGTFSPDKLKGIFGTRSPHRPNHIGVSVLKLQKREKNKLYVKGVDMVDESPVFDIKPVR